MPSRNLLLRSFGPALEALRPRLIGVTLRAGQVLYEPGQRVDRVYFPVSGLISARALLESGHQMECSLVGRTNALGAVAAVGFHSSLTRDVCLVEGHAWTLSLADLLAAVQADAKVAEELRRFSYAQMAYSVRVGVCNAMHTAEQRIARWMLIAVELQGEAEIRLPQEELSNTLGLQRSAVSPALQKFKSEGLLDLNRGRIGVLDTRGLRRRACECCVPLGRIISAAPAAEEPERRASFR